MDKKQVPLAESIILTQDFVDKMHQINPALSRAPGANGEDSFFVVQECDEFKQLSQSFIDVNQALQAIKEDVLSIYSRKSITTSTNRA